jgi:hypothetical protein
MESNMKLIVAILATLLCLGLDANAQTNPPSSAAAPAKKPPAKDRVAPVDGSVCKWKGGDFSAGAEFCVFSGRALVCENGAWKHEDLPACVVTPPVFP